MKLYVAGPMRGLPDFNFPAFDAAADFLRSLGHEVISPAEHDREVYPDIEAWPGYAAGDTSLCPAFDFIAAITWDMKAVLDSDGIVLLPGWEASSGVAHELYVAKAAGKFVFFLEVGLDGDGRHALGLRPEVELPPFTLVGLMGYAQSGKDTVASILVKQANFRQVSFAAPLRDMLYALNPMVDAGHQTWGVKALVDTHGWEQAKAWSEHTDFGTRQLLQRLGTEAGRNVLGENIWVDTAMRGLEPGRRYVFSDVRFPNEAQAIKDAGGRIARVWRTGYGPINAHPSETALDSWLPDVTLINDGTPDDLIVPVRQLLDPAFAK